MAVLRKKRIYDRRRVMEEAERARSRKRRRKAISLYRWVLAVEPNNVELHAKLAPLLAQTGQSFDAWRSYRVTASAALRERRDDKALAIYRDAANYLPHEIHAWQRLAHLLAKQGEKEEAVGVLIEGSRQFRTPFLRSEAVHLLRRARAIDPWHHDVVFELAQHLGRSGQCEEARLLLEGLAQRTGGHRLRRVRAAQVRLNRTPAAAWRWLRSVVRPEEEPVAKKRVRSVVPLHAQARR
jgi:thioredoxin-like negative regulator of GroEL